MAVATIADITLRKPASEPEAGIAANLPGLAADVGAVVGEANVGA